MKTTLFPSEWVQKSQTWKLAQRFAKRLFLPIPLDSRHVEYSAVYAPDQSAYRGTPRLWDIALQAITAARTQELSDVQSRLRGRFRFPDDIVGTWPGEHYALLAGLVSVLRPLRIVEIGTAEGMSALTLKKHLPSSGRLVTYDLIPWQQYPNVCLEEGDFADGRLRQEIADLSDERVFEAHRKELEQTDLFFIDAAKDGKLEHRLIHNLEQLKFSRPPIVVFDDIRVWNMLRIWSELRWPKLDLTSFGHWSGTGICELIRA